MIYYSLIHPYFTSCINVWSFTYRTIFKTLCAAQKRSVRTLFATAQQPHSRDIFINKKILFLDKLLNDFLNHGDVRHQIQLRSTGDLRIPLYAATQSQLFVRYKPSIRRMAYQVTCAAHHHSVLSRINYDCCICLSHSFQISVVSMIIKLLSSSTEVTMQYS